MQFLLTNQQLVSLTMSASNKDVCVSKSESETARSMQLVIDASRNKAHELSFRKGSKKKKNEMCLTFTCN